jgi:hypothetical protein
MKKKLLFVLTCSFAFLLSHAESQAPIKKLIHYWHFNNTVSAAHLGAIPADYSTLGNASVIYKPIHGGGSDTTLAYIDNLAGDIINQRPGYGGCCGGTNYAVRTRNPSDNMQFLWYIPTNKYQNIVINYETQSSSLASGQARQVFSYSLDSALTFVTAGLPVAYDSAGLAWGKVMLDLSSIPAVNNNGKLVFKMTFTAPNTGTSGNNRFDNITVEGDTIMEGVIVSSSPKITSTALTTGTAGSVYTYNVTATGTPAPTYTVSGNPDWLILVDSTLSGIPTSSGLIGPVTIIAKNSASLDVQTFYINVANPAVNTAASKLIHYWHFNNTLPADGSGNIPLGPGPILADYSSRGIAAIVYKPIQGVSSDIGVIDNLIGDTLNQRSGYGGCCGEVNNAVRTRNPSDSMQFLWYLPTTMYKNIVIKYETQLSSLKSGQHEQIFSYSLDSASTFSTTGLPVFSNFADTVWEKVTLDLRSITSVNNNRKFVFRINFSAPNTGNKGNNRFDNITVEGDIFSDINGIREINKYDYALFPNPAKDHIILTTNFEGEKMISIYNSTGVLVSSYNLYGKEIRINTSLLSSGFYYMKIIEKNGENVSTMKFIKE